MFEGEYALRELRAYRQERLKLISVKMVQVSYPLRILVGHKNVCILTGHPALVIKVLQCLYAILKERSSESGGVAESAVVRMR